MRKFGLIGKNINYSFSMAFFDAKFKAENITDASYENFDIENIRDFPSVLDNNSNIKGLNVTIPYKELIIPYLDKLNKTAREIGAVNTIKLTKKGHLKGYNTDYFGFKESIKPLLRPNHKSALILGTGGASKAVAYALDKMEIQYQYVTRLASESVTLSYNTLTDDDIKNNTIIINCTPLGTFPNVNECPNIPYHVLTENHLLFDLIYNPKMTQFLKKGKQKNATTINGLEMLRMQAEKAWRIWNH